MRSTKIAFPRPGLILVSIVLLLWVEPGKAEDKPVSKLQDVPDTLIFPTEKPRGIPLPSERHAELTAIRLMQMRPLTSSPLTTPSPQEKTNDPCQSLSLSVRVAAECKTMDMAKIGRLYDLGDQKGLTESTLNQFQLGRNRSFSVMLKGYQSPSTGLQNNEAPPPQGVTGNPPTDFPSPGSSDSCGKACEKVARAVPPAMISKSTYELSTIGNAYTASDLQQVLVNNHIPVARAEKLAPKMLSFFKNAKVKGSLLLISGVAGAYALYEYFTSEDEPSVSILQCQEENLSEDFRNICLKLNNVTAKP